MPHDLPPLTLDDARRQTGLDLKSAEDVCEKVSGHTYAEMERTSESPTHARLRDLAIRAFADYGYRIYPSGVGVRDVYAMADFLAVRDQRAVFVEVLTDAKATPADLARKQLLSAHGELAFVFIGSIGNRDPDALEVQTQASKSHDVLLGCWGRGACDWVAPAHPFQRFAFRLTRNEPVVFGADVTTAEKRKRMTISLITEPYPISRFGSMSPEPTTTALPAFVERVADIMADTLHSTWSKPRRGRSILKENSSGKRLAMRLVPGSRRKYHVDDPFEPLSIELEPASVAAAIAAARQTAEENRLGLTWSGNAHEVVADHATGRRPRPSKAVAPADVADLLRAMRATDSVILYRIDLLRALGWTAQRGNRVIRQLAEDGLIWRRTATSGQIICGLMERQRQRGH